MAFIKIPAAINLPILSVVSKSIDRLTDYYRQLLLAIDIRDREISSWINSTGENLKEFSYTEVSSFLNSWVNYGSGWPNAAYGKTADGWVSLRGIIKSGTINATAFTLPVGYKPVYQRLFVVMSNDSIGRVNIWTNGNVDIATPSSSVYVSLDNIWFYSG